MTVFVFGNPDVPEDAIALKIVPRLRRAFPDVSFEIKDPHEEWDVPENLTVIDTAAGIEKVRVFYGLEAFASPPRVSLHDFDALSQLRYLQKLGKIKKITIIGIPPTISENSALDGAAEALRDLATAS